MGNFADKLAAVTGQVKTNPGASAAPPEKKRPVTGRIDDPRRAGRAPYNFVPLPEQARWLTKEECPPVANRYADGRLSGEIEIEMTALTDFYIRGLTGWNEYLGAKPGEKVQNPEPYKIAGRLALPASSLRGMIRTLVEILGESPLDPVNDSQLFFRTVGSTSNPGDRNSFEPHAVAYKSRVDSLRDIVKAGYLYGNPDEGKWHIVPAETKEGRQFYQVPLVRAGTRLSLDEVWQAPRPVWFRPAKLPKKAEMVPGPQAGCDEGLLICTGPIPKKRHQWVLRMEAKGTKPVAIPEWDVLAYLEDGITQDIKKYRFEYGAKSKGVPCFYVEWKFGERQHVSFGHTCNMRLPFQHTVGEGIPLECRRRKPEDWDMAQAIFGRTDEGQLKGRRGRLFFEDAVLFAGPDVPHETKDWNIILGQPKPTTFQHYLVQPKQDVLNSIHWDGNYKGQGDPVVRGHKRYFHRPGVLPANITEPREKKKKERVVTILRPAKKDCVFRCGIRFENLSRIEMGAVLSAIELPEGCAHKLGMAKPQGFGSMRLRVVRATAIDRKARYVDVFSGVDASGAMLNLGAEAVSPEEIGKWKKEFATWATRSPADSTALWKTPRLAELKALLTFDGLPPDWSNRTRYLEFGSVGGTNYNEYKNIGYPKKDDRGKPFLEQRRPLPAATQVLTDSRMPSDARPPFEEK